MMKLSCFAFVALVFTNVRGQGNGAIRLFNNGHTSVSGLRGTGIVEVYYNLKWNTVCATGTNSPYQVANTICRQLGYAGGITTANSGFGNDQNSPGFSSVSCDNSEINLLSCDYDTTSTDCTSSDYLAVQCDNIGYFVYTGKVVLRGFTEYSGRGRIEALCNDSYGLVCNDGFTKNDADTVCRQLGYTEAASYGKKYGSGGSSQSVWFENPGCSSKTKCLSSCHSCPSSSFNCSDSNVAGVMCSYNTASPRNTGTYGYCFFADNGTTINKNWVGIVAIIGVIVVILVCVLVIVLICCCRFGVIGIGARARRPQYSDI